MEKSKLNKLPKWAQKEIEEIEIRGTHLWPTYEKPKPVEVLLKGFDKLTTGWFSNAYTLTVSLGCSNGFEHNRNGTDRTTTWGPGVMYATKKLALMAARWERSMSIARDLQQFDKKIEDAENL